MEKIMKLCEDISLQPEVTERVFAAAREMDFSQIDGLLPSFYDYDEARSVHKKLEGILGEDPGHMKMLAAMLYVSSVTYKCYQEKGIPDEIYFATMSCYTRFLEETHRRTGEWYFDRFWWTARQAGGHLFRIGTLEYEMKRHRIGIHIPSDADLRPSSVNTSLAMAQNFFHTYFPETTEFEYICHSWMMDPQLQEMLRSNSNILRFQRRFEIFDQGEPSDDVFCWVFQSEAEEAAYDSLPEDTSLQRNVKRHLTSGGLIYNSYGKLIRNPKTNKAICHEWKEEREEKRYRW